MTRILLYSHDTYGLGNIRRMLAIATHVSGSLADVSVLIVSGSPMVQGFRIAAKLDYIKLPSVTRTDRDGYATRSLGLDTHDVFELRANLVLAAVADFKPDVILVDKKPFGIENELEGALYYAKTHLPGTSLVLVLRDILDRSDATIRAWRTARFADAIERYYDRVLVLGSRNIFDPCREYCLPPSVCRRIRFCGYIRRPRSPRHRDDVRRELGVGEDARLVLVTPGGGQDGARILAAYASALPAIHRDAAVHSLIVTGPEMPAAERLAVQRSIDGHARVVVREFTEDMMAYIDASDVTVCMGGYNTICELATLRKRTVVVPRVRPVEEQLIRATRLARMGVVSTIHPDRLTAASLAGAVRRELAAGPVADGELDLRALPRVTSHIAGLAQRKRWTALVGVRHRMRPIADEAMPPAERPSVA